jgi:hypothetical protein
MTVICLLDIFLYTSKYNLFQNNVKFRIPLITEIFKWLNR